MSDMNETCSRCYVPKGYPGVSFDEEGVCSICRRLSEPLMQEELKRGLAIDRIGELKKIAAQIKKESAARKSKFDCIIGASGGFDSTYVIYIAKKILGLTPLVVKYDNGLCHKMANNNLKRVCDTLGVELRIQPVLETERGYFLNATKALINLGIFFSACFSCHYIIASVVYKEAKKENIKYMLTSTNHIERNFATASHGLMLKSIIKGFFRCKPLQMLKVFYYELIAIFYFIKLKFSYDKFSFRFFRNLVRLHPVTPSFIKKIDVSEYVAWDWPKIEKILRGELLWETPRRTKVPYFRFDCHYSAMIDKSFKKVTGISGHALLMNWFIQAGFVGKQELEDDIKYMNDDNRINKEIEIVFDNFDLPKVQMRKIL